MGLLLLEALAVLGIAIFIVWWTMFSGRGKGDAVAPRADDARIGSSGGASSGSREGNHAASGPDRSEGRKPDAD